MTQTELIDRFPESLSIRERVLLICPDLFPQLEGISMQECRMFILVTEGAVTVDTGVSVIDISARQLVDLLVWEPLTFVSMSDNLRAWCLLPNYLFTNESLNDMKPADSESFKDRHRLPVISMADNEVTVLEAQLRLLLNALNNTSHHYRAELCQTYFRSFMLETGNIFLNRQAAGGDVESVENRQDIIVRSFLKLVWKYYQSEHNLDFYAEKLCLSSKHLSRVVTQKLGKTPYSVIRDEMLQRAAHLLRHTKMSVTEIAADLHFSEMASFCKFFKNNYGVSPTAYRHQHR